MIAGSGKIKGLIGDGRRVKSDSLAHGGCATLRHTVTKAAIQAFLPVL
jgi:hypothetical protein